MFQVFMVAILVTSCNGHTGVQTGSSERKKDSALRGDTAYHPGNNIMVIYQDSENRYWFGSWRDGLYRYDGKSTVHYTTRDGLPDNRIEEIREDHRGNIYVNTSKGIGRYSDDRFVGLPEPAGDDTGWTLHPDDVWFKSTKHPTCLYRFDGKRLHRLRLPKTELGEAYIAGHPGSPDPYAVYTVYRDRNGHIWAGTAVLGAVRYNGRSFDWISEQDVTEIHDGPSNGVRSVIEDKEGNFWFNTNYKYKMQDNPAFPGSIRHQGGFYSRIKSIGSLDGKRDGETDEYLSVAKDDDQNLWFATYRHGVWKYDGKAVTHYPVQVNGMDIHLFCIYKDKVGILWLGTPDHGAFKFNGRTFEQFNP